MSTHKIQLYLPTAVKEAAEELAEKLGKKAPAIYRDAIAVYLVAQGVLTDVADARVRRGVGAKLDQASASERKRLQAELRARMKRAREALAARRAEKKRKLAEAQQAEYAKLQSIALKIKRTLS